MNSTFNYISLLLISVGCIFVASSILTIFPEMCAESSIGKHCWFHLSLLFLGSSVLFTALFNRTPLSFRFRGTDLLILLLAAGYGFFYHWNATSEPYPFSLSLQLVLLWFMLRIGLTFYPQLSLFILSITLYLCCVETILGIRQFFHFTGGGRDFLRPTGSFFNAVSFGAYLALLLPVSLCWVLRYGSCRKSDWWEVRTLLFYTALPALLLSMIVLPIVISFTTWLAAVLPCLWIGWHCFSWGNLLKKMKLHHSVAYTYASVFLLAAAFITVSGVYVPRLKGPAEVRTLRSAAPPETGPGAVVPAFKIQTVRAEPVASTPADTSRKPVSLFLLLLFILAVCIRKAYRKRMIDVCGALLAAWIYIALSFPHVRPPFLITLTLIASLSMLRQAPPETIGFHYQGKSYRLKRPAAWKFPSVRLNRAGLVFLAAVLLSASYLLFVSQGKIYTNYCEWLQEKREVRYELFPSPAAPGAKADRTVAGRP